MSYSPYLLNERIKRILLDIIDVAYSDESDYMRDKYKEFRLLIEQQTRASYHGRYTFSDKTIVIVNMYRGTGPVVATCLHELSHHIDYIKNGRSGHQKPFYIIFRRLIYASLDIRITKKSDFITTDASDSNKVRNIIDEYIPHKVSYTLPSEKLIKVRGHYNKRQVLKEFDFSWNAIEQVWEKPLTDEKKDAAIMKAIGIDDYEISDSSIYVDAICYLYASGKTYDVKDILKAAGFYYNADNKLWLKKVKSDDFNDLLNKYRFDDKFKAVEFGLFVKD